MEQRIVKNKIKFSEILKMLTTAFEKSTLSQKNVHKWYKLFTEGREDVNDEAHPGCPSTSTTDENVEAVEKIIMENRRITIREVSDDVRISVDSCHAIFFGCFGYETCASEVCSEIAKF